jgi:hypothetical protein
MRSIAELNMLLRVPAQLPVGLKLATNEFHEGWGFVTGNANSLERKIRTRGWNFIKIADGSLRSGVGETSQEAIASALKLALRRVSMHFNAVEVEHIELTRYPWFFLARIRIYPYRIQEAAVLAAPGERAAFPMAPGHRRLPADAAALYPDFGSAMPQLKQMLILSAGRQARAE